MGRFGGPQLVSLQPPDTRGPNCLGNEGRAIHELLHALGIFHEQSRADRDQFVEVHMENVIPGNVWGCTWRMLFQVMCGVHMGNVILGNVWGAHGDCYSR